MGNSILKYYEVNQVLDDTRKAQLIDLIMKHFRVRYEEYNTIAAKIITLFPKECMGTNYVSGIRNCNSANGRFVLPRSKLVDKVKNVIQKCEEAIPKRKKKRESGSNIEENSPPKISKYETENYERIL
ncbi:hypothetical protein ILUMI_15043 [Ignelater luminosus]|uniref:Uncharacterized protein n=1 Tax=Ignelater luminosus TaxID=2038154 RepID=A0A8K0CXD7_IGNLU|nr:hypothetical protein ILUMI_15043 [Ignelater luminosus]